jgi:hypothetical protein
MTLTTWCYCAHNNALTYSVAINPSSYLRYNAYRFVADGPSGIDGELAFENVDICSTNSRCGDFNHDASRPGDRNRFVAERDHSWSNVDCRFHRAHANSSVEKELQGTAACPSRDTTPINQLRAYGIPNTRFRRISFVICLL